jgi:hypothetical protein
MCLLPRRPLQIIRDITLIVVPSVSTSLPLATTVADKVSEAVAVEVAAVGEVAVAVVVAAVVAVVVTVVVVVVVVAAVAVECLHSRGKELHSEPCLTGNLLLNSEGTVDFVSLWLWGMRL